MNHQVDNIFAGAAAFFTAVLSFAFDVPAPAIFSAFMGTLFAVAFAGPVTYKTAAKMIIGGTVATGLLCSFVIWMFGGTTVETAPIRGFSSVIAFCLVRYREKILEAIERRIQ